MRRARLGAMWAVLVGVALFCPLSSLAASALPRSTTDRPDDFPGLQVHMVYAVPSGAVDRGFDTDGSIQSAVDSFQQWLIGQTGDRRLRVDTFGGLADVTYLPLAVADEPSPFGTIDQALLAAGLTTPGKVYAVYYEGGTAAARCGGGGLPEWPYQSFTGNAVFFLHGNGDSCFSMFPPPGGGPTYPVFAMFHDTLHAFGIVGACAPHHHAPNPGHVDDSNVDLMYGGPLGWVPSTLDVGHDDYYRASIPGCVDLDTVGFLTGATSSEVTVTVDAAGDGRVVSTPWPLIDCGSRCGAPYVTGTVIALEARPEPEATFAGWGGACSGLGPCLLTVDSSKTVTARFLPPQRTAYASFFGTGRGMIVSDPEGVRCPPRCAGTFAKGTTVSFHATPEPGSSFVAWGVDCTGRQCRLTLNADQGVEATFADVQAPRVRALPSKGRRAKIASLRYRVDENMRLARVTLRVRGRAGRVVGAVVRVRRRFSPSAVYAAPWHVPRSLAAGHLRFCVQAVDRARRVSRSSCASLVLH